MGVNYHAPMHWIDRSFFLGLGLLVVPGPPSLLAAQSGEETPLESPARGNPYQVIIDRNPFRLKDPVIEAPEDKQTNAQPPVNVKFTGIYRVNGVTKACLALVDPTVKPPANPNRFYALAEGEWQDGVKVLEIDSTKPTVKVESPAGVAVLNFKDNGFAAAGAPPPTPGAVRPGAVKPPGQVAGVNPGVAPRLPGTTATLNNAVNYGGGVMGGGNLIPSVNSATGARTIPSRQLRTQVGGGESGTAQALIQYATAEQRAAELRARGLTPPPMPPLPGLNQPQPTTGENP